MALPSRPPPTLTQQHVETSDIDEAGEFIGRLYQLAKVEVASPSTFSYRTDVLRIDALTCVLSALGSGCLTDFEGMGHYVILSLVAGAGNSQSAGGDAALVPRRSALIQSPDSWGKVWLGPHVQTHSVFVDPISLANHFAMLTGQTLQSPLLFASPLDMRHGAGLSMSKVLDLLLHVRTRPEASPLWLATLQDMTMTAMLTELDHSMRQSFDIRTQTIPISVRRAEEYMDAHADQPLRLADIAAAAGVPARTLQAAFRATRNMAPLDFLRQRRLELARERLSNAVRGATVAKVGIELGFTHLGRFAGEYAKRFQESPSTTLARSRARLGLSA